MKIKQKTVWQVDQYGLICEIVALSEARGDYKESQWLIPAGCVEIEPPAEKEGFIQRWNGDAWEYAEIQLTDQSEENSEPMPPTKTELQEQLDQELRNQMDGLQRCYVTAQIRKDTALQTELRSELEELELEYQQMKQQIEEGINPWEGES